MESTAALPVEICADAIAGVAAANAMRERTVSRMETFAVRVGSLRSDPERRQAKRRRIAHASGVMQVLSPRHVRRGNDDLAICLGQRGLSQEMDTDTPL